jgi:hypothetical protein
VIERWLPMWLPMWKPGPLRCGFPRTFGCRLGVGHAGRRTRWCGDDRDAARFIQHITGDPEAMP